MNDGIEREILEEIAEKLLMKKEEIIFLLENKVDDPLKSANEILNSLIKQGLITPAPVGTSAYAVTQKGMREARKV
jgi:predicted transcriptional regulator